MVPRIRSSKDIQRMPSRIQKEDTENTKFWSSCETHLIMATITVRNEIKRFWAGYKYACSYPKPTTIKLEMFCNVRREQYMPLSWLTASVWLFSVVLLRSFEEDIKIACSYLKLTALWIRLEMSCSLRAVHALYMPWLYQFGCFLCSRSKSV